MLMPVASEAAKIEAAGQVLVAAEGVSMAFHGKPAVENVAIVVHASEIVTLIGPSYSRACAGQGGHHRIFLVE